MFLCTLADEDHLLFAHQLLYITFCFIAIILILTQLFFRFYYWLVSSPIGKKFGVVQNTYHICCTLAIGVFVVKAIDPIGWHGVFTIPILYTVQDIGSYIILLVIFVTIFEACHTCYHQLDLYSQSEPSKVPRVLALVLLFVWIFVCSAIFTLDMFIIQTRTATLRSIVYFVYTGSFLSVFCLLQWIGHDLTKSFHFFIPAMFQQYPLTLCGKIQLMVLGAYRSYLSESKNVTPGGSKKSQESYDGTKGSDSEVAVYHTLNSSMEEDTLTQEIGNPIQGNSLLNPLLARLFRKFIRFLILRRAAQVLCLIAIVILIYYGLQVVLNDPNSSLPSEGVYNLKDDVLSWLQAISFSLGIWYCWIPLRCHRGGINYKNKSFDTSTIQAGLLDSQTLTYNSARDDED